jgi:hypothetical protein
MWRMAGVNDPDGGYSAGSTLSHPAVETTLVENYDIADGGTENNVRSPESEPDLLAILFDRVRFLENQVLKIKTDMQHSISQEIEKCGRMLSFKKHKLGIKLNRSLPGTTSSQSKFNDAHTVSQSFISLQADCTLAEFENTCKLATTH